MAYKITEKQLKNAKSCIITHPYFGTIGMIIKKVKNNIVEGLVWDEVGYHQYNMPEDYHGNYEYMNFPITCVKEID